MAITFQEMLEKYGSGKKTRKKPREDEHKLQVACVKWFRTQYQELRPYLFAVPNGGRRDETTARKLKDEGVVAGVSDLILMLPNKEHHALLIEMKTETGRQSPSQAEWQESMEAMGYHYVICRSLYEFIKVVRTHLER